MSPLLPTGLSSAWSALLMLLLMPLIVGCGTAPELRLHSLLAADAAPSAARPSGPALRLSVAPVSIPAAVDQPQWLVRRPDDTLQTLEQDRWASPLQDEVRAAVREGLAARWGVVDVGRAPPPADTASPASAPASPWRLVVEVLRFDMRPGRDILLEVRWSLVPPARGAVAAECSYRSREPVTADGTRPLAEAQRRALGRLVDDIGRQLRAMAAGAPATCVGAPVA